MSWTPVPGHIMTRWAQEVRPDDVWPSYPRPQMTRPEWRNLNGLWAYGVTHRDEEAPRFQGDILVPFPIEAALSGVKQPLLPDQRLWYRRTFEVPADWGNQRILLHFGAVDWETTVWVNEHLAGSHRGGYLPFHFDITDALKPGENELLVAVWDPTDAHWQARGKQVLKPKGIWYTAVSGIWQTVWLEPVPPTHIARLRLTPDIDAGLLRAEAFLAGEEGGEQVEFIVWEGRKQVARARGRAGDAIHLPLPDARLWSPEDPHLYDLQVILHARSGEDQMGSYFGMRKFSVAPDDAGQMRLHLNHRPLFHYGPLDQGYWPDGLYTPPTEAAMRFDVDVVRAAGCNMLRKHVKVEPAQFYAYCDRQGVIVWQDMPNGGKPVGDLLSILTIWLGKWPRRDDRSYGKAGRADPASREDFRRELREMVDSANNFL
jgi:beta-galactosidase/beta-glucuronidase